MSTTETVTTPLDSATFGRWVLQQLVPDTGVGNGAWQAARAEPVDPQALTAAAAIVIDRHPALRAAFRGVDGVPVREVQPPGQVPFGVDVLVARPETLSEVLRDYAGAPFDLRTAPLIRIAAVTAGERNLVCVVAHQSVVHGGGVATLFDELGMLYTALLHGATPPELPPPPPVVPPSTESQALAYWREHIAGFEPSGMRLAGTGVLPERPSFGGTMLVRPIARRTAEAVSELRKRCRATDATVLLAAYYLVLRRHGAAADAVVGMMVDAGHVTGSRPGLGNHAATVPLRVAVPDELPFDELVRAVARTVVVGLDQGVVSVEEIVDAGGPVGDDPTWWRARLFRHMFNYRPRQRIDPSTGWQTRVHDVDTGVALFDLELIVDPGKQTTLSLLYSTEVHDEAFAGRFLDHLELALCTAVGEPGLPVGRFDLRTAAERALVRDVNDTAVEWPAPHTVAGMVLEVGATSPDETAVWEGGHTTSYRELLRAAGAVRAAVVAEGGGPGTVVGVALPRSAALAATVLGVWSAGAAYLPLDPGHPRRRLVEQLDEIGCRLLIGAELLDPACGVGRTAVTVPDPHSLTGAESDLPLPEPHPDEPAYVIFTSGSTGRPKGVWQTHRGVVNVVRHFAAALSAGPGTGVAWLTTFAFDVSALDLGLALATGGRLIVVPDETRGLPERLLELVERTDARIIQATPATWRLVAGVAQAGGLTGRMALCGGEPLTPTLAAGLLATGARVFNLYGTTETTIWSTMAEVTDAERPISVGTPIANTTILVLDRAEQEQPVGVVGEMCIAGAGLTDGYRGRPELTEDRFVGSERHGRYYRTGDRAHWQPDGTLRLLGRTDRQIKLRANRIEPAEIERVLEEHPDVSAAAVVLRGDPVAEDAMLVAFVAADRGPGLAGELWTRAATRLPAYCLPGRIVPCTSLPITPNGKVDMRAISEMSDQDWEAYRPQWPDEPGAPAAGGDSPAAPEPVEATLVELWREVLGSADLDRDAHFFLMGGNSLLAVRLAQSATERLRADVSMGMIFRAPTPAALATAIMAPRS